MTSAEISNTLHQRSVRLAGLLATLAVFAAAFGFIPAAPAGSPPAETIAAPSRSLVTPTQLERPQQFTQLGIASWNTAGFRGKGVKVAVLDSGFRGYRAQLGKTLPEKVLVHSFRCDGNLEERDSQHGVLCGEVIHTLAPDAELLFANWEADDPQCFLDAVRWARKEGARIISCSVIMPSWSDGEGGGATHEALSRLLGAGDGADDVLFFASAGNVAERHWGGAYHDGGDGFHEWLTGETANTISPWGDERVSVELCCRPESGYDVYVYDRQTEREVGHSLARDHKDQGGAVVKFQPEAGHKYQVRVHLATGKGGLFHLTSLAAGLGCATAKGSVPFPADGPEVLAVGAVNADGRRMNYSSCGPNSSQPKPDFVAPVPFASHLRTTPFGGTSAAAPQAAAVAALGWSRFPELTAKQLRAALRASARDLGAPGHDTETGYGMVQLPEASADLVHLARTKEPQLFPKKTN